MSLRISNISNSKRIEFKCNASVTLFWLKQKAVLFLGAMPKKQGHHRLDV